MSRRVALLIAVLAALVCAAPATASPVLVYDNGHVTKADDPWLPAPEASNAVPADPQPCTERRLTGAIATISRQSVRGALRKAYDRGDIDRETWTGYAGIYSDAKSALHRLSGNRKRELSAVITSVNQLAARKLLVAGRMAPVFLELQRNTEWWTRTGRTPAPTGDDHVPKKRSACKTAARIAAGGRIQFKGDPLTLQYYPGSGLRLQPLANFGAANALYNACKGINTEPGTPCEIDALKALLDRLVATASRRGNFLAWEYYFPFGGGNPPWVSGIATGSALSALSRTAQMLAEIEATPPAQPNGGSTAPGGSPVPPVPSGSGATGGSGSGGSPAARASADAPPPHDSAFYLDIARQALPVYEHAAPLGIRASGPRGNHYLIYSFNKGLRVGNAFLESLIGLWDFWQATGDKSARALFIRGDREARHELPLYDTGAWTLYSLGGAESDLNYQRVIRDFAEGLCERTKASAYCTKAEAFDSYLHTPAKVRVVGPKTGRVKKTVRISIHVDKISCLAIQILRGDTPVYQPVWYFPRGTHSFSWTPPKAGTYRIHVLARDLMSRQSRADADLRVLSRR